MTKTPKTQHALDAAPGTPEPIAVVGVSALFPGSLGARGFWSDILRGKDLLRDVPASHWLLSDYYDANPLARDKTYANRGAFLEDVEFDPMAWGVPPSSVPATDTSQLLALIVAQRVLEDATRGDLARLDRSRTSVILGVTSAQELLGSLVSRLQRPVWSRALRDMGLPESEIDEACERIAAHYVEWQESSFPGLLGNVVAGRIANRLDLGGTNCVCDAACASAFSALSMAVNELQLGHSDVVIAGGVDTMNDIFMYVCFSKTPALSRTGDCRPFSDKADGTMLGEGLGMVALKRLSDAEAAGDPIYAVIRGVGSASDGRATSVYAPLPEGQARALRRAYAIAGYAADTVELVEAHGTGTMAGDAAELAGLRLVFEDTEGFRAGARGGCALGSVKSQIGHTKAAAGAAGLFKAIMALHHKVLPPTIKVERPSPKLDLESSPFHLATRPRPWLRDDAHPRRAGVSAFGFGGSNFHVALEEYVGERRTTKLRTARSELVVLGAETKGALASDCRAMAAEVRKALAAARETTDENEARVLALFARASQRAFGEATARASVVAESATELAQKLEEAASLLPEGGFVASPRGVAVGVGAPEREVCFVFPGQGSQYVRMGEGLAMTWDDARKVWDHATTVVRGLGDRCFPRPSFAPDEDARALAELTKTEHAQPAIGAASLATLALLQRVGVTPSATCGHSFGEVTALCAAGVLSVDDALRVAQARGERMAEAARRPGAMSAVLATRAEVEAAIADVAGVGLANHNAPNEVVISGDTDAVARAEAALEARGLKVKRLNVATAFHSPIVAPAVEPFAAFLHDVHFAEPRLDVFANGTAAPYAGDPADLRRQLATQLSGPVRFVESIEAIHARGVRTFVEVGPGAVLTGLVDRILEGRPHFAIATDRKGKDAVTALHEALGRLAALGVPIALDALLAEFEPASDPRATPAPKMVLKINGSNYGKLHPANPVGTKQTKGLPPRAQRSEPAAASPTVSSATAAKAPADLHPGSNGANGVHGRVKSNGVAHAHAPAAATGSPPAAHSVIDRATAEAAPPPSSTSLSTSRKPAMSSNHDAPADPAALSAASAAVQPHRAPLHADAQLAWVAAYQEAQRQTAEAHAAYQRAMAETHQAFLRTAETSFTGLAAMLTGGRMDAPAFAPTLAPARAVPVEPTLYLAPQPLPLALPQPAAPAVHAPAPVAPPAPAPIAAAAPPAALSVAASAAQPASVTDASSLEPLMLEIVAAKTGYPVEMLGPDMDLESDLGVDSIKRVEILAALRERRPGLPELDMAKLGAMRTLGQIVAHVREVLGVSAPAPSTSAPRTAPAGGAPAALEPLMLEIVAAKTGYPVEMLGPDMDLESDLGVDSIKRVEILAALRERTPNLPELDMAKLGALRTLGQIVAHVREVMAPGTRATELSPPEALARLSAGAEPPETKGIGRWVTAVRPAQARGLALPGLLASKRCVVTEDDAGLAAAIVARLRRHGVEAEVAREVPSDADALIELAGLGAADRVLEVPRAALAHARAVAEGMTARGGAYVVVQDAGGDFGLSGSDRAWVSGLTGLLKTAAQEWPRCGARALDVERGGRSPEAIADVIVDELLYGGHELEVGLRADGTRLAVVSEPLPVAPLGPITDRVAPGDVVVISGGARGVTAACTLALVRATRCRVVLLARTPLAEEPAAARGVTGDAALKQALLADARAQGEKLTPAELSSRVGQIVGGREVREVLAQIRAAGGDARYEAVDVTDARAVARVLEDVRRTFGPIVGVVHGAGVISDKLIAQKTEAQLDRVLSTKVAGLRALLDATADDPLKLVVLFSSVAGRAGNRGQSDYAIANEILNKVACSERRARPGCVFKSLGWGPWESGMVSPSLRAHLEKVGVPMVTLDGGPRAMLAEIAEGPDGPTDVVLGAEPKAEALAGDAGSPAPRTRAVEVLVDARSAPFIDDHRVRGAAVVPMVLAIEWLARAAEALCPGMAFVEASEVRVLRGIKLARFEGQGDRFVVQVSTTDGEHVVGELLGEGGVRHYAANLRVASKREPASAPASLAGARTPWPHAVYGDALFHGPAFQCIQGTPTLGADGIEGTLLGARGMGWRDADSFVTDPALLDGALQLAVTFCKGATGGSSLPTALGRLRWLVDGPPAGSLRCIVRSRARSRDHTSSELAIVRTTERGEEIVAEIAGLDLHVLPGTRTTAPLAPTGP
jgi:malonyl CoA-acyl carrier protein transacylase